MNGCIILCYHRVSVLKSDPQLLAVTPEHFRDQLAVISQLGTPISLRELLLGLSNGDLPERGICLTFDDGYADNSNNAKPLLEQAQVPATVFVSTAWVGSEKEFWWDELERLVLQAGTLAQRLTLETASRTLEVDLGEATVYGPEQVKKHAAWAISDKETPTQRHEAYREIYALLFHAISEEREAVLQALRDNGGLATAGRATHQCMEAAQVRELDASPWVEVGGHAHTHPVLSFLDEAAQRLEIRRGQRELEEILGRDVELFSYPFGGKAHFDQTTRALVQEYGCIGAVANFPGKVDLDSDPYQLPRHLVRDWPPEVFKRHIETWLGQDDRQG